MTVARTLPFPDVRQFADGLLQPLHSKHHSVSRYARTSAVVDVLPLFCLRRSNSSLLIRGSVVSLRDELIAGVRWASTRPASSHSSSGSVKLCSFSRISGSRTILVMARFIPLG